MRLVTPQPCAVADARRVVADPDFCARHPHLARFAWLILRSRAGEIVRQAHRPAPSGDAA